MKDIYGHLTQRSGSVVPVDLQITRENGMYLPTPTHPRHSQIICCSNYFMLAMKIQP